jgi:hypothetical protein
MGWDMIDMNFVHVGQPYPVPIKFYAQECMRVVASRMLIFAELPYLLIQAGLHVRFVRAWSCSPLFVQEKAGPRQL